MSKRNADAISQSPVEGIDGTNNNSTSTTQSTNDNIDATLPPKHYIRQTILGPVCTHTRCNIKVNKTKSNFTISDDTLRDMLRKRNAAPTKLI